MFGGVCGKKPETANLQDLLIYVTKGLSEITTRLRSEGKEIPAAIDRLITTNLFMTITNANFDDDRFIDRINETLSSRDELFEQLHDDTGLSDAASWQYRTAEERTLKADEVGVLDTRNEDLRSLRELTLYGLKGICKAGAAVTAPSDKDGRNGNVLWHDVLCRLWLDPVPVQSDRLPKGSGILHLLWISQRKAGVWHTTLHPNGYPGGIDPSKSAGDRVLRQKP